MSPIEMSGRDAGLRRAVRPVRAVALAGALAVCSAGAAAQDLPAGERGTQPDARQAQQQQARSYSGPESFATLAREKLPTVVNVSTTQARTAPEGDGGLRIPGLPGLPIPPGSPLEDFFERFAPPDMEQRPDSALGSGFIVDPSGYIVTNNHVVEQADEVKVILSDETELPAEVIGTDPLTDLALLKVETDRELTAVEWGNSDEAEVGDWVLAIGNPFGLGGTVTSGIISARARQINAGPYDDFLQTDASINRGNSGGPLFDMDGLVVGVNTAIFSPTGGSVGIGFAIPSSIAQPVIRQLREEGEVVRGYLGVQIQPITPEIAEAVGLDEPRGALVADVVPGSPAAEAGIEPGDVILEYAGDDVAEPRLLSRAVAATEVGTEREVVVLRDGERQTLDVEIARLQSETEMAAAEDAPAQENGVEGPLGLELSELTPELRRQYGIEDGTEGVVVTGVERDSVAAEQGFQPGDVIRRIGGEKIETPDEVSAQIDAAREADRNSVLVLRERQGNALFAALPLAEQVGEEGADGG
ncbi:DegQ family serine endoprotease [Arenibaculum sp.]|uniref:DegQ family serine endoprotease n=1 Tax=Arenibaculum sp. TaxID=2865862 RepID=UPI002E0D4BA3|nr:DegQ family serine endoprotease [Arenibaculum sp.]